jgi:hypothetical protein
MRKIFIGFTACIVLLMGLTSCQDQIDEQFANPETTVQASIPKFFTFMIDNSRVRPDYWNVRTFLVMHPGLYTQSVSYLNGNRRYQQQFNYLDDFWRDYYTPSAGGVVAQLREIEKTYATLSDEEKAEADVFLNAAKVLYYDQTLQMVDLWGDIPFFKAGSINLTGQVELPEFDKAEDIYAAALIGLEEAAAYFASGAVPQLAQATFTKQDILMQGSVAGWRRYANSLRLRALMRISNVPGSTAQAEVMEMLNAPNDYPLVETAAQNILLRPLTTFNDNMRNALTEVTSHIAPEYLLDEVLKPSNDPRIRVLFDKNRTRAGVWNADYYAMPTDLASTQQETNITDGKYAVLDSLTFLNNRNFPGIVFTSQEVQFLKAEALERWGTTGAAQTSYELGVTQAIEFTFYLNSLGDTNPERKEQALEQSEVDDYLAETAIEYTGTQQEKLRKIWTQKWITYGFMQSIQSWAEVRRNNWPVFDFVTDASNPDFALPGSRLLYPPNEKTYNSVNYGKVADEDNIATKIFWDVN